MSDHDFEKKVQLKMDELRLRPSEAVWTEVERNLRRDKRRRRTLLWLPLVGVLLTGGYFLVTATGNDQAGSLATHQAPKSEAPSATPSSRPENATARPATAPAPAPEREPASTKTASSSTNKSNTSISENSTPSHQSAAHKAPNKIDVITGSNKQSREHVVKKSPGKNKQVVALSTSNGKKRTGDKTNNKIPDNNTNAVVEPARPVSDDAQSTTVNTTTDETNKTDVVKEKEKENVPAVDSVVNKTDSVSNKQIKQEAKKAVAKTNFPKDQSKWQWGLTASAGAANVSEGSVFDMLKAVRVEDLANATRYYNGIPAAPAPEASPIRTGPAFSIGAFVQRKMSNRISLSLGLQYSYVSVYTQVGKKVDSVVSVNFGNYNQQSQLASQYYSGANSKYEYTNRYHFIEMPIMASWQFMRIAKAPLTLDAGASLSRLINTNALHFDGTSGVYYENNDFFNRTQVSLNAGLGVGLFGRSKHPLIIGPNIRYYATGLVKDEVTSSGKKQHIWTFGLNAKMLLKK